MIKKKNVLKTQFGKNPGVINHLRHLKWENYELINEATDLQMWVVNLRLQDRSRVKEAKTMALLIRRLSKVLHSPNLSQYRWNEIQIRIPATKVNRVYSLLRRAFKENKTKYNMVICNYIKNETAPVGHTMCDGLVEAGMLYDYYKERKTGSYCLFYDRRTRLKAWIK